MLVRAPHLSSDTADGLFLGGPRGAPFDVMKNFQAIAEAVADRGKGPVETSMQICAASLIIAVENLVHHGDHPFLLPIGQSAIG